MTALASNNDIENEQHCEEEKFIIDKPAENLQLIYHIDDNPPWQTSIFLGFQHYLTMFGGTVAVPLLLAKFFCINNNGLVKTQLICTVFFVCGLSTLLQCTIGVRLPIVQGATFSFISPTIAILNLQEWKCTAEETATSSKQVGIPKLNFTAVPQTIDQALLDINALNMSCWKNICSQNNSLGSRGELNQTQRYLVNETQVESNHTKESSESKPSDNLWNVRVKEIQGAIAVASLMQVLLGASGAVGFLMKYIGPLTITPTITLIGLSLTEVGAEEASTHWGISILTMVLVILFSQYLRNISMPFPSYSRARGVHKGKVAIFELFPVLIAIITVWILCVILTAADTFPAGHPVRTDTRSSVLFEAPWFRVPYPGQWGTPTVSIASVIGMTAGVIAGIVESVGDYYACARLSGAPPVPKHALNRGILVEGIGCVMAGLFGSGSGTTSYSENIGAIGITKIGSRRVVVMGGVIMVVLAVIGKFGALFATIPEPIIGGVFVIMFSVVTSVGLSNLQFVNLNSVRNLFVLGFSLFFGLLLPKWVHKHPQFIDTGSVGLDQIIFVQLDTSMWIGGLLGFILDNTLPGTDAERGIIKWRECQEKANSGETTNYLATIHTYDIPYITPFLQRFSFIRYIPFLPYYVNNETQQKPKDEEVNGNAPNNEITDTRC